MNYQWFLKTYLGSVLSVEQQEFISKELVGSPLNFVEFLLSKSGKAAVKTVVDSYIKTRVP